MTSMPSIDVIEADDVIFTEIAAGLYFDDFERHFAKILETVDDPQWNMC